MFARLALDASLALTGNNIYKCSLQILALQIAKCGFCPVINKEIMNWNPTMVNVKILALIAICWPSLTAFWEACEQSNM